MKGEEIILLVNFTNMQLQAGKSSGKQKVHDNSALIFCRFLCDM